MCGLAAIDYAHCGDVTYQQRRDMEEQVMLLASLGRLDRDELDSVLKHAPGSKRRSSACQAVIRRFLAKEKEARKLCAECGAQGKNLVCSRCKNIWYCGRDCQVANWGRIHKNACQLLAAAKDNDTTAEQRAHMEEEIEQQLESSFPAGRSAVLKWPRGHVPETWDEYVSVRRFRVPAVFSSARARYVESLSTVMHRGLTIALAAKRFGLLPDALEHRAFRVHVLGADEEEVTTLSLLSLGDLARILKPAFFTDGLDVTFIGPRIPDTGSEPVVKEVGLSGVELFKGLYHDFVRDCAPHRPDLIVAFNSGAHTGDAHHAQDGSMWILTLSYIIQQGIPALFTSYDDVEAGKLVALLNQSSEWGLDGKRHPLKARIVFGPELNPMRCLAVTPFPAPNDGGYETDLDTLNAVHGTSRIWVGFQELSQS